jgi:hypothetical protein
VANKKGNLSYDLEQCVWRKNGEVVTHPRYSKVPRSLDGKSFIKSYLRAVKEGATLNEWIKTNQAYSKDKVQRAAKEFRAIYEAHNPGMSFRLLKLEKRKTEISDKQKNKAIADSIKHLGDGVTYKKKRK